MKKIILITFLLTLVEGVAHSQSWTQKADLQTIIFKAFNYELNKDSFVEGLFHQWMTGEDEFGNKYRLAIIELKSGEKIYLDESKIVFADNHENNF